jgi:hypothetical protein
MAKGKYANVIDRLPRSFGTEPDYQAKVNAVKKQIIENAMPETHLDTETILKWQHDIHKELIELAKLLVLATGGTIQGSELARVYRDLRGIKDMLEGHVSNINLLIEAHAQMLSEQYEVEGIKSLALNDGIGGTVRVQYEPMAKVVDRDAFREWCIKEGLERQLMLPWQTTNKLTKEALLNGEAEPDGVTAESRPKFVYTRA